MVDVYTRRSDGRPVRDRKVITASSEEAARDWGIARLSQIEGDDPWRDEATRLGIMALALSREVASLRRRL